MSNPPAIINAVSTDFARCDCGCGTLKLYGYDASGAPRVAISYRPEQWFTLLAALTAECVKMLAEEEKGIVH